MITQMVEYSRKEKPAPKEKKKNFTTNSRLVFSTRQSCLCLVNQQSVSHDSLPFCFQPFYSLSLSLAIPNLNLFFSCPHTATYTDLLQRSFSLSYCVYEVEMTKVLVFSSVSGLLLTLWGFFLPFRPKPTFKMLKPWA